MTDTKIICTQTEQQLDYNTNKYITIEEVTKTINEEVYNNNIENKKTCTSNIKRKDN